MRFYDVQKGRILLDGVDVRDWDLAALRENFAVVLQDVFLFSGTVEGNIRLGRSEITEERVEWAATEVRADRFIKRLPEGYKSEVRERGAGLSVVGLSASTRCGPWNGAENFLGRIGLPKQHLVMPDDRDRG